MLLALPTSPVLLVQRSRDRLNSLCRILVRHLKNLPNETSVAANTRRQAAEQKSLVGDLAKPSHLVARRFLFDETSNNSSRPQTQYCGAAAATHAVLRLLICESSL